MSAPLREVRNELQQLRKLAVDDDWLDDLRLRIDDLCTIAGEYLEQEHIEHLREACYFAAEAHAGVYRKSGEPYIFHPLAVARILANVRFDHETLLAALLHNVIEDTPYDKEHISACFGPEVAELVDGVSKLTQIHFNSKLEAQAENFRKMFLAMAKDLRIIMIKLADRLHNMRTLGAMRPDSRRRIARETLEIYAPIAGRLGMNHLRQELEDLGLSHLYPFRFRVLQEAVRRMSGNRHEIVSQMEARIDARLQEEGINARVVGRSKHLWGIYQKMRGKLPLPFREPASGSPNEPDRLSPRKSKPFRDVYDVYAVRIIVDTVDTCYRVLGVTHNLYKPIMGRFKDYIAIPKANGYQSLHTTLIGPYGTPVEVQIRTQEMHHVAQEGVASHWLYKDMEESGADLQIKTHKWLQSLLEMQTSDSAEFFENVKIDLFPDEVYIFTPKGKIMAMPLGATVVDFAYAVHTDVGHHCSAARVNHELVPLRTELRNGDLVEIITSAQSSPNPIWLSYIKTGRARSKIRHFLRTMQNEESARLGERLLRQELLSLGVVPISIPTDAWDQLVKAGGQKTLEDLYTDIGLGKRLPSVVARRLLAREDMSPDQPSNMTLAIHGTEGMAIQLARCCQPIPGDPIIG